MDNFLNYFADKINPIYDQSLAAPAPVYFKNIILGGKKKEKKSCFVSQYFSLNLYKKFPTIIFK